MTIATFLLAARALVELLCLAAAAVIAAGLFKHEQMQAGALTAESYRALAQSYESRNGLLERLGNENAQTIRVMEIRLRRVETDAERKSRLLAGARQEIEMLEAIVRITVSAASRLTRDEKSRVERILAELAAFRLETRRDQDGWDDTRATLQPYLEEAIIECDGVR